MALARSPDRPIALNNSSEPKSRRRHHRVLQLVVLDTPATTLSTPSNPETPIARSPAICC
ncbi:MAG: hypothetical protein ACM65L_07295 [Microcoleus sp.]